MQPKYNTISVLPCDGESGVDDGANGTEGKQGVCYSRCKIELRHFSGQISMPTSSAMHIQRLPILPIPSSPLSFEFRVCLDEVSIHATELDAS